MRKFAALVLTLLLPSVAAASPLADLTFHPASEPNGEGILVVPGGGYSGVSLDYEGANTTAYLNARGYDAWVLNYSTASTAAVPLYPKPQQEALAAVEQIRAEGHVSKLGIWGYSAGGHLAAMTLTEPGVALDFGILAYPVITMDPAFTHGGSRRNLIGNNATLELQIKTSAEKRVTSTTPPTFIFHTANDPVVPVQNTLWFIDALAAAKVPFQSLVLPDGNHGIALALTDPVRNWTPELERWLKYSV
ncbi:Alpha/Beta hydrolase protein [Microdochium bolleyi]|uniref:Alpha/Beta hydrolase protein n=1 Tax=Microdochium bolleyi TaxID=196109 RepID=A0A136ILR3_9PEZI|nr:Alpha/Beta hydrolase protein [Microdochium bolleyi]